MNEEPLELSDEQYYAFIQPLPGDIVVLCDQHPGVIHRLNGPYTEKDVPDVITVFINEVLDDGDTIHWFYQPLDILAKPLTGDGMVWSRVKLQ